MVHVLPSICRNNPVLLVWGQVSRCWRHCVVAWCAPSVAAIDKALKEGGNTEVSSILIPDLNHMLQPAKTGLPEEVDSIDLTIAPEVLVRMKEFIHKQSKRD